MGRKKDQEIAEVVSNLGFAFELLKVIANAVIDKGGTMDHLRRIVNEPELQASIAELVVAETPKPADKEPENTTAEEELPPDHYRVHMSYKGMPSYEELKKEWGEDCVSSFFDGRTITLHESCQDMDRTPGEKIFYLHDAGTEWWESEEQIVWGRRQCSRIAPYGYRPATHEEVYEFAKAHPELANFVGLGSFVVKGVQARCSANVCLTAGARILFDMHFYSGSHRGERILFVAK